MCPDVFGIVGLGVLGFMWLGCLVFEFVVCPGVFWFVGFRVVGFVLLGCLPFRVLVCTGVFGFVGLGSFWVHAGRLFDLWVCWVALPSLSWLVSEPLGSCADVVCPFKVLLCPGVFGFVGSGVVWVHVVRLFGL